MAQYIVGQLDVIIGEKGTKAANSQANLSLRFEIIKCGKNEMNAWGANHFHYWNWTMAKVMHGYLI